jgi:5-methylcytosine-specific restriction endonuclease McrA
MANGNARCALCGKLITGNRDDVHVDHIVPFRGLDDPLRFDQSNWQLLHPACHSRKTAMDQRAGVSARGD